MAACGKTILGLKTPYTEAKQALEEESKVNKELSILKAQLKTLRRASKQLQRRLSEKETITTAALEEYAKTECRKLCDKIYSTFPREVRDIIYENIHPKYEQFVGRHNSDSWNSPYKEYFASISESHWRRSRHKKDEDHLWSADHLGSTFLREVIEMYYHSVCFQFEQEWDLIPAFRTLDQWNVGFVPADFVTNVEITIESGNLDIYERVASDVEDNDAFGWVGPWDPPAFKAKNSSRSHLLSQLEVLFGFKAGTKMNIKLWLSWGFDGDFWEKMQYLCDAVIPLIFPTVQRLNTAGYYVHLILSQREQVSEAVEWTLDGAAPSLEILSREFEKLKLLEIERRDTGVWTQMLNAGSEGNDNEDDEEEEEEEEEEDEEDDSEHE